MYTTGGEDDDHPEASWSCICVCQVQDVLKALKATLLYEVEDEGIALSTEVAQYIVGTLQLSELLNFLPLHTDPTKGSVVITSASRVDILLGLIQLHESKSPSSLAAVVLTGGRPPPKEVDALVKVLTNLISTTW